MKATVNHLNQILRAVNTGGGDEDGVRRGPKLLSQKMQSRCALVTDACFAQASQRAVHLLHACVVPECFPARERAEKGQIQRVLGRHWLPGVNKFRWVPMLSSH